MRKSCQVFVLSFCFTSVACFAASPDSTQAPIVAPSDSVSSAAKDASAQPVTVDATVSIPGSDSGSVKPVAKPPETIVTEASTVDAVRQSPDFRVFNDPALMVREYGFGAAGSLVAGALCFYIGSGIESAIYSSDAHKGTLRFSGIRYDNYYGAFWGGSAGILFGSALTTYFIGQTDEEEGGLFPTLLGTAVTTGGALAIASWMGVNDEISVIPFIPLLALPSIGGVIGFNVSRWFNDHKREGKVGSAAIIHWRAPSFGWIPGQPGGDKLIIQALNLGF